MWYPDTTFAVSEVKKWYLDITLWYFDTTFGEILKCARKRVFEVPFSYR